LASQLTANIYITRTYGLWWLRRVIHIKPSSPPLKPTRDNMKAYVAVHDSSEA